MKYVTSSNSSSEFWSEYRVVHLLRSFALNTEIIKICFLLTFPSNNIIVKTTYVKIWLASFLTAVLRQTTKHSIKQALNGRGNAYVHCQKFPLCESIFFLSNLSLELVKGRNNAAQWMKGPKQKDTYKYNDTKWSSISSIPCAQIDGVEIFLNLKGYVNNTILSKGYLHWKIYPASAMHM